eukprot:2946013-Rhodomonas_salina.5
MSVPDMAYRARSEIEEGWCRQGDARTWPAAHGRHSTVTKRSGTSAWYQDKKVTSQDKVPDAANSVPDSLSLSLARSLSPRLLSELSTELRTTQYYT